MNKRILDVGSVAALIALVAFGVFAVAGGLGGSDTKAADTAREAACLAGSEECDDTVGDALGVCAPDTPDCVDTFDGDIAGICLAPEEGVEVDLDAPCIDTPDGGGLNQTCPVDVPDCSVDGGSGSDGFVSEPGEPGSSSPRFSGCGSDPECDRTAIEAAFGLLESDGVSGEITSLGAKGVNWPNACLGVSEPDVACAEVITPGFVVTLQRNGQQYTFHTDTNGNAVSAPAN